MTNKGQVRPYFLCDNPFVKFKKPYSGDTVATMEMNRVQPDDFTILPCGKCDHCLEKKAKEWGHRMVLESKVHDKMAYLTLTFNDESLRKSGPSLNKREMQLFLKRLRKAFNGRKIRYFIVGEYGPRNLRKHYHAVLFNVDGHDYYGNYERLKAKLPIIPGRTDWHVIHDVWKEFGFSKIEKPKGGCFHYLSGYVTKISKRRNEIIAKGLEPEFRMMSKGLGSEYVNRLANRIKNKKVKRPEMPLQFLEYNYRSKKTGRFRKVKRGLGRYLKNKLHQKIGMDSVLEMWNKLHEDIIRCEYGLGIGAIDKYLIMSKEFRDFENFKRLAKDTYG